VKKIKIICLLFEFEFIYIKSVDEIIGVPLDWLDLQFFEKLKVAFLGRFLLVLLVMIGSQVIEVDGETFNKIFIGDGFNKSLVVGDCAVHSKRNGQFLSISF
jgi:hypothetical protein